MIVKFLISIILAVGVAWASCSLGCLVCNSNGTCDACDTLSGYKMGSNKRCVATVVSGCDLYAVDGSCLNCSQGKYIVDTLGTQTCVKGTTIPNCNIYSGPSTCSQCVPGFYTNRSSCSRADNNIRFCKYYGSSDKTCEKCHTGNIISFDKTACSKIDSHLPFCKKFTYTSCKTCNDNALASKNTYLIYPFNSRGKSYLQKTLYAFDISNNNASILGKCLPIVVDNCVTLLQYNKCNVCKDGYYVDTDSKCSLAPSKNLTFCKVPSDLDTCSTCNTEYYLNSEGGCSTVTPVTDCAVYSSDKDSCARCIDGKILDTTNNTCGDRQTTISNCQMYFAAEEKCEVCESNFILANESANCYAKVDNCVDYLPEFAVSSSATCVECSPGFYVNNAAGASCVAGNVTNCKIYENVTGACTECQQTHYIKDGACQIRSLMVTECNSYEIDVDGDCNTCSNVSGSFTLLNKCEHFSGVDNCDEFADVNTCITCKDYFDLDTTAKTCTSINTSTHCLKMLDGKCVKCESDYNIEDGSCAPLYSIASSECQVTSAGSVGVQYECDACATNAVSVDITDSSVCLENSITGFTPIDNCNKHTYDADTQTLACDTCNDNYFRTDSGTCVESCSAGYIEYYGAIVQREGDSMYSSLLKSCEGGSHIVANCDLAANSLLNFSIPNCLTCSSGNAPIKSCKNKAYFSSAVPEPKNIAQAFSTVDCIDASAATNILPNNAVSSSCKTYKQKGNYLLCSECHYGYTGVIVNAPNGYGYVKCDVTVSGCDASTVLGTAANLSDDWVFDMFGFTISENYTCHKCTDEANIPFLHLTYFNNLRAYGLSDNLDNPSLSATLDGKLVECRAPVAATFNLGAESFDFPENCGLGLLIINENKAANYESGTIRCIACKNGYKKAFDSTGSYINECEEISNCDTCSSEAGVFDGCRTCGAGYAHQMAEDAINYQECYSTSQPNDFCDVVSDCTDNCIICKPGYILTSNGICDKFASHDCSSFTGTFNLGFASATETSVPLSGAGYYLNSRGRGCNECSSFTTSSVRVVGTANFGQPTFECQVSENVTNDLSNLPNCAYYSTDVPELKCYECSANFTVSSGGTECFANTNLTGCKVANSASECDECNNGYHKIGTACIVENIPNCVGYTDSTTVLECSQCEPSYILNGTTCSPGSIPNCEVYNYDGSCSSCLDGYLAIGNACEQYFVNTDCVRASIDLTNKTVACLECKIPKQLSENKTEYETSVCYPYDSITGCAAYNYGDCTACESSYYISDGECITRTSISNCSVYDSYADECSTCESSYLLSDDNLTCKKIVTGIPYCAIYSSETECAFCSDDRYVVNNVCVVSPTPIPNCDILSDATNCKKCDSGYWLSNNTCILILAKDCRSHYNERTCSTCTNNFKFKKRDGSDPAIRDCIAYSIDKCVETLYYIEKCRLCEYPYYPQGKLCQKATSDDPINNCQHLKSITECSSCKFGFVLNSTGTACIDDQVAREEQPYCNDIRYNNSPLCAACNSLYFFSGSSCVACRKTVSRGCNFCDPMDESKCLACSSGFSRDTDGSCVDNNSAAGRLLYEEPDDDESFSRVLSIWLMSLLVIKLLI